jgi:peptidyl-tRNA hydrolase
MEDIVLYIIVRESLSISIGKTAAQCAHVVQHITEHFYENKMNEEQKLLYNQWRNQDYRKVVLKADEKEWLKIKELSGSVLIIDKGFTEIPENTETVIGFYPMIKNSNKLLKRLQLLK